MAESHDGEKSRAESFGERIGKFAATHKVAFWGVPLLALIGGWTWHMDVRPLSEWKAWSLGGLTLLYAAVAMLYFISSRPEPTREPEDPWIAAHRAKENDWIYPVGAYITGLITFVVTWIYCIATYGFLFGFGLGWLPSIILAYILGLLWPLILIGLIGIVLLFLFNK